MPLRGVIGTDVLAQRADWKVIDNPFPPGDPIVVVPAIKPDVALFHAPRADRAGNVFIGRSRDLLRMAQAARESFVTVEEIVDGNLLRGSRPRGGRDPRDLHHAHRGREARRGAARPSRALRPRRRGAGALCPGGAHRRGLPRVARRVARAGAGRAMSPHGRPKGSYRSAQHEGAPASVSPTELLIATVAQLLAGCRNVVIGNASPIPGSAALLARELAGGALRLTILGSRKHTDFTDGGVETFDRAAQGRVDAFFLGGGQIDGEANINLVGAGAYPRSDVRWPGSYGSAYLYFLVPKVILFREEHTPRVFVPKVDFVSAAWHEPAGRVSPGRAVEAPHRARAVRVRQGAQALRARERPSRAYGRGDRREHRLRLRPGGGPCRTTPEPGPQMLALIRGRIRDEIAETYPKFAAELAA